MQEIIFGGITISNCGALGTGIQSGVPSSLGGCVLAGWVDISGGDKCRVRGCEEVEKRKKKVKKVESPNETLRFSQEREGWITHPAGGYTYLQCTYFTARSALVALGTCARDPTLLVRLGGSETRRPEKYSGPANCGEQCLSLPRAGLNPRLSCRCNISGVVRHLAVCLDVILSPRH